MVEMALPYPLLARGKIIDTDMNGLENVGNIAQRLAGGDIANTAPPEFQIERLQRMLRAYEESERSNAVAVRSQVVLTLYPLLIQDGSSVEEGISRADKISDFILNGITPDSPTPEPKTVSVTGDVLIQASEPWGAPIHVFGEKNVDPYPFMDAAGKRFGFRWSDTAGCAEIVYAPDFTIGGK